MQDKNALIVEAIDVRYDCPTSLQRGILRVEYLRATYSTLHPVVNTSISFKCVILFVSVSA